MTGSDKSSLRLICETAPWWVTLIIVPTTVGLGANALLWLVGA